MVWLTRTVSLVILCCTIQITNGRNLPTESEDTLDTSQRSIQIQDTLNHKPKCDLLTLLQNLQNDMNTMSSSKVASYKTTMHNLMDEIKYNLDQNHNQNVQMELNYDNHINQKILRFKVNFAQLLSRCSTIPYNTVLSALLQRSDNDIINWANDFIYSNNGIYSSTINIPVKLKELLADNIAELLSIPRNKICEHINTLSNDYILNRLEELLRTNNLLLSLSQTCDTFGNTQYYNNMQMQQPHNIPMQSAYTYQHQGIPQDNEMRPEINVMPPQVPTVQFQRQITPEYQFIQTDSVVPTAVVQPESEIGYVQQNEIQPNVVVQQMIPEGFGQGELVEESSEQEPEVEAIYLDQDNEPEYVDVQNMMQPEIQTMHYVPTTAIQPEGEIIYGQQEEPTVEVQQVIPERVVPEVIQDISEYYPEVQTMYDEPDTKPKYVDVQNMMQPEIQTMQYQQQIQQEHQFVHAQQPEIQPVFVEQQSIPEYQYIPTESVVPTVAVHPENDIIYGQQDMQEQPSVVVQQVIPNGFGQEDLVQEISEQEPKVETIYVDQETKPEYVQVQNEVIPEINVMEPQIQTMQYQQQVEQAHQFVDVQEVVPEIYVQQPEIQTVHVKQQSIPEYQYIPTESVVPTVAVHPENDIIYGQQDMQEQPSVVVQQVIPNGFGQEDIVQEISEQEPKVETFYVDQETKPEYVQVQNEVIPEINVMEPQIQSMQYQQQVEQAHQFVDVQEVVPEIYVQQPEIQTVHVKQQSIPEYQYIPTESVVPTVAVHPENDIIYGQQDMQEQPSVVVQQVIPNGFGQEDLVQEISEQEPKVETIYVDQETKPEYVQVQNEVIPEINVMEPQIQTMQYQQQVEHAHQFVDVQEVVPEIYVQQPEVQTVHVGQQSIPEYQYIPTDSVVPTVSVQPENQIICDQQHMQGQPSGVVQQVIPEEFVPETYELEPAFEAMFAEQETKPEYVPVQNEVMPCINVLEPEIPSMDLQGHQLVDEIPVINVQQPEMPTATVQPEDKIDYVPQTEIQQKPKKLAIPKGLFHKELNQKINELLPTIISNYIRHEFGPHYNGHVQDKPMPEMNMMPPQIKILGKQPIPEMVQNEVIPQFPLFQPEYNYVPLMKIENPREIIPTLQGIPVEQPLEEIITDINPIYSNPDHEVQMLGNYNEDDIAKVVHDILQFDSISPTDVFSSSACKETEIDHYKFVFTPENKLKLTKIIQILTGKSQVTDLDIYEFLKKFKGTRIIPMLYKLLTHKTLAPNYYSGNSMEEQIIMLKKQLAHILSLATNIPVDVIFNELLQSDNTLHLSTLINDITRLSNNQHDSFHSVLSSCEVLNSIKQIFPEIDTYYLNNLIIHTIIRYLKQLNMNSGVVSNELGMLLQAQPGNEIENTSKFTSKINLANEKRFFYPYNPNVEEMYWGNVIYK